MYDLDIIDTSPDGISQCCELLQCVYASASHITPEYLDWQYNQNPAGKAIGFNAYHDRQLVAHYVTLPIVAGVFGKETRGLLSLNTATHQDHRGKKLFTTLAAKTYDHAKENGYEFVVGVANANSTPGFVRKLGFQLVRPLDAKLGIGQVARKTRKVGVDFKRIWNRDTIRWRLNNPSVSYRCIRRKERFEIVVPTGMVGIHAILGEFDVDMFSNSSLEKKLSASTRSMLKLWMGIDENINWQRSLYLSIPTRLRPSPLNLIFKDLTGGDRGLVPDKVTFRALDFDPY